MLNINNIHLVELDCPYDSWDEPKTKDLFHKAVSLKIRGYQAEYPYGVLPIDTSDFVGVHHLVCEERSDGLQPIMAYRTITSSRCKAHRMGFPPLTLMQLLKLPSHEIAIRNLLVEVEAANRVVGYASSLTIDPNYRGDPLLKEILKATHVLYHREAGIRHVVGGGVLRFKVDSLYSFWGYDRLSYENIELPPVEVPFVMNEVTGFFVLRDFSQQSLDFAEQYRALWNRRVRILPKSDISVKSAA